MKDVSEELNSQEDKGKRMSDLDYRHIGSPAVRLIEECGELIQALCKAERFGWDNHHPDRPHQTNLQDVEDEMGDVIEAFGDLTKAIHEAKGRRG